MFYTLVKIAKKKLFLLDNFNLKNKKIQNLDYFSKNFDLISENYLLQTNLEQEEKKIKQKANEIIQKYSIIEGISYNHGVLGVCGLLQSGAHLKNVFTRLIIIENIEFTKKSLLFASEQVGNKYSLKSIARSIRDIISQVSFKYNIPGHLYKRFKVDNPDFIPQDLQQLKLYSIYCTDFNFDNFKVPLRVRKFLCEREKILS